ncbi:hypothetical protein SUGI_0278320 [Cryptomeria japonica]|nr:hypothetical protein SUGI_0278320 [Cryptomeria japonica]
MLPGNPTSQLVLMLLAPIRGYGWLWVSCGKLEMKQLRYVSTSSSTLAIKTMLTTDPSKDGCDEEPPIKNKSLEKTCGEGPLFDIRAEKEKEERQGKELGDKGEKDKGKGVAQEKGSTETATDTEKDKFDKEELKALVDEFADIGCYIKGKDNSGDATSEELKTEFESNIDALANVKVFNEENHSRLARIDSSLTWCANHTKTFIAKCAAIRTGRALWGIRTRSITILRRQEILAVSKAFQDYKNCQAQEQPMQQGDTGTSQADASALP